MAAAAAAAAVRLLFSSSSSSSSSTVAAAAAAITAGALAVTGGVGAYTTAREDDAISNSNAYRRHRPFAPVATTTTTRCEAAAAAATKPLPGVNLRSRMTAIGHFSILSETIHNPSICTFVMTLSGKSTCNNNTKNNDTGSFSARDFCSLWKERDMAARHPRFHLRASETHPGHFESTTSSTSTSSSFKKHDDDDDSSDPVELHVSEGLPLQSPTRRADILQRIAQMQTQPWSLHEKLWHVDIIPSNHNNTALSLWRLPTISTSAAAVSIQQQEPPEKIGDESSLILFRGHHVLADGASIGAALMDLSDEAPEFRQEIVQFVEHRRRQQKRLSYWQRFWQRAKLYLWLCTGSLQALWYQTKLAWYNVFWNTDPWSIVQKAYDEAQLVSQKAQAVVNSIIISNSSGADNNSSATAAADLRSVSYITMAPLEQAKWIADTLSNQYNDIDTGNNNKTTKITINDLFVTAITAAVLRQLKEHRQRLDAIASYYPDNNNESHTTSNKQKSRVIPQQNRIHVSVPVHLKGGVVLPGESVGNNIGAFTVQLPGEKALVSSSSTSATSLAPSPVQRLWAVHQELTKVKQTPAPLLSNLLARTAVACLPRSWTSYLFQRASAGSTCVITNVRGPSSRPMHMNGHTVESIYGFVPLPPGIPIGVVVSSYAGQMLLTVTAERWAVPNADLFLSWVVEEYLVLLQEASRVAATAAAATAKKNTSHPPPKVAS